VRVVLVHQRDVVVDVGLILEHTPQPILDDHRDLIGKRRPPFNIIKEEKFRAFRLDYHLRKACHH
jgi:hypothetical protein